MIEEPWPAPAKLNRFLHIVGRRADGYHLLQTVFQFIDRCDYLTFEIRVDRQIGRRNSLDGISEKDDLAIKAACLLQKACDTAQGVAIEIDKRLPMGGGLGGGSSDAATTLVALNHYWHLGLSVDKLAQLGLQLGADVPVFVRGQNAWAEGIGEQLTPIILDEPWFLVLVPACSVATKDIFNDSKLTRNSQPITIDDFKKERTSNDCAAVVYRHYPKVAAAAAWLSQYAKPCLTGTGACVFAAFSDYHTAERITAQIPKNLAGFITRGVQSSPLRQRLDRAEGKI
jgi:4-diphosphocytidyl-2-C-methyl-D-erythritol kinase